MYTFTVFTPTYNRKHTLPGVFESLLAQTYRDLEWLIVDDGSTDGTEEVVASTAQASLGRNSGRTANAVQRSDRTMYR